jgi:hypothetical protein
MSSINKVSPFYSGYISKRIVLAALVSIFSLFALSQSFNTTTSLPFDLDGGTNYSACGTPGNKSISFTVSGVGTLNTTTNQLAEINIRLDASCGGNVNGVVCYIKSPAGTCVQIASQMGTTTSYSGMPSTFLDYSFRNAVSCLNKSPDYAAFPSSVGCEVSQDGRYGIFSTTGNIATSFNGQNADGTWTIYFSESAISAPCVNSGTLKFGNPSCSDQTANGETCATAIAWNGTPMCASTNGKSGSTIMPGWNGSSFAGCQWNAANNNDVWIKFQPTSANVCIAISGLVNDLQSIIVTDPNTDGDNNPCTGAGSGTYWTSVNCPRTGDNIYAAVTGTTRNQNHCFTAVVGQTYYLVVDGNGGAESPFYITGISGVTPLPITLVAFNAELKGGITDLFWETASQINNDYFQIERSVNGIDWELLDEIDGAGNSSALLSYRTHDFHPSRGVNYYRLKQVDFDGKSTYSEIRSVYNTADLTILPNPSKGIFGVGGMPKHQENSIVVIDLTGKVLQQNMVFGESFEVDLTDYRVGIYFVTVNNMETIKIIKE